MKALRLLADSVLLVLLVNCNWCYSLEWRDISHLAESENLRAVKIVKAWVDDNAKFPPSTSIVEYSVSDIWGGYHVLVQPIMVSIDGSELTMLHVDYCITVYAFGVFTVGGPCV